MQKIFGSASIAALVAASTAMSTLGCDARDAQVKSVKPIPKRPVPETKPEPATGEKQANDANAATSGDFRLTIVIEPELETRLAEEASQLGITREQRVVQLLEYGVAPLENFAPGRIPKNLAELAEVLDEIPGLEIVSKSEPREAYWWIKFQIDIRSKTAWEVVQYLAFVFNDLSLTQKLPTVFKPTSAPPYLNGGPDEFLYWVVEAEIPFLDPAVATRVLRERLPSPIDDEASWLDP